MQYIGIQKQITSIWKIIIKNIELSYFIYLDSSNLDGWAIFQKLPVEVLNGKKCV